MLPTSSSSSTNHQIPTAMGPNFSQQCSLPEHPYFQSVIDPMGYWNWNWNSGPQGSMALPNQPGISNSLNFPQSHRPSMPGNHNYLNSYPMPQNQQNPQLLIQNYHQNPTFPPLGYDPVLPMNPPQHRVSERHGLAMSVNGTRMPAHHHYHSQPHPYIESTRTTTRHRYTDKQLEILISHFETDAYPVGEDLTKIVDKVGVTRQQVSVWFQNRRSKNKMKNKRVVGKQE